MGSEGLATQSIFIFIQMNNKLFVGGLSWGTTDDSLMAAFQQAGNVLSAKVMTDRETGRSRGFGFVEMETDEEALSAIDMWNDRELDGRGIKVNIARPKEDRPRTGGFGGGDGGFRRR